MTYLSTPEMATVPAECVDVDFKAQPRYVYGDTGDRGPKRFCAEKEYKDGDCPVFEDSIEDLGTKLIERPEWKGHIEAADESGGMLDKRVTRIYDQRRTVSCTSNASGQATEIVDCGQRGPDMVVFKSAMSLYCRVGGPSSGSSVDANLRELKSRGILPLATPENSKIYKHVMKNVPDSGSFERAPAGYEETAKNFKVDEYYEIRSLIGFATAILLGFPVVYGRSGHAICAVRMVLVNGTIKWKYANSWHESWGDKGFGYDSESMIRSGAYYAFAIRTTVFNPYAQAL